MNKDEEKKPAEADEQTTPDEEKKPPEDEPKPEDKPEEKQDAPEEKPEPEKPTGDKPEEPPAEKPDNAAELDRLKAENLRLTTQIEAIRAGFSADLIEEAVLLAENIAGKENCTMQEALRKVSEKFPEWKKDPEERKKEKKGGIRVGAPTGEKPTENAPKQPTAVKRWNRVNSI